MGRRCGSTLTATLTGGLTARSHRRKSASRAGRGGRRARARVGTPSGRWGLRDTLAADRRSLPHTSRSCNHSRLTGPRSSAPSTSPGSRTASSGPADLVPATTPAPRPTRHGARQRGGGPLALPGLSRRRHRARPRGLGAPVRDGRGRGRAGPDRRRATGPSGGGRCGRRRAAPPACGGRGPNRRRRAGAGRRCRRLGDRRRPGDGAVRGGRSARGRRRRGRGAGRTRRFRRCGRGRSSLSRRDRRGSTDRPVVELRWVRGIDAGRTDRLAPGSWVIGTSPQASVCRADAGAPQAAVVEVSARGEVTVEELVAGAVTFGPTGDSTDSTARWLRVGGGEALVRALVGDGEAARAASRSAPRPGRWTKPVVRQAGRAPLRADEPEAPPSEPPPAKPAGPSLLPPLLSLGAGVVLAVVAASAVAPDPRRGRCRRVARHLGLAAHPARQGSAPPASRAR